MKWFLFALMISLSSCHWFIPSSIKREISFIKTDVEWNAAQTSKAVDEVDKIMKDVTLSERERMFKVFKIYYETMSGVNASYGRVVPHLINLHNFANGDSE